MATQNIITQEPTPATNPTVCAWCPRDEGESPDASHGICEEHQEELLIQSALRAFNRVPSYAERFQDGRAAQ